MGGMMAATRRRRPRNSLNQQVIVDAAFAIVDRGGIEALTFAALGRALGAHPTAIYRHFRDKDELLLAITDALQAQSQENGLVTTDDWRADLRQGALDLHAAYLRHPRLAQLAARTARRPHEFRAVEHILSCLRRAGFDEEAAARHYRAFGDFVLAHSSLDAALAALEPRVREADLAAWDGQYRRLSAQDYPNIAAVARYLPELDDPGNFTFALDLMIEAIARRATGQEGGSPG
ncbi:TetR/AcrR family transcriptional regulator [Amycolatopsis anabasis]|uniref:TetR/AcrR family transcriptional regulator n=1 Tax=Amycolatopsis anabasis TaxID=1840409 RepID=UPI001FE6BA01|nr:TetR/AcrR family transcriptional regulator C-terminal domain-containing protein [Amycolatopsis anabasis]